MITLYFNVSNFFFLFLKKIGTKIRTNKIEMNTLILNNIERTFDDDLKLDLLM